MENLKRSIRFAKLTEIRDFVNLASQYSCHIIVKSNDYVADGKSILGILSLALWEPVVIYASGTDAEDFLSKLSKFKPQ